MGMVGDSRVPSKAPTQTSQMPTLLSHHDTSHTSSSTANLSSHSTSTENTSNVVGSPSDARRDTQQPEKLPFQDMQKFSSFSSLS